MADDSIVQNVRDLLRITESEKETVNHLLGMGFSKEEADALLMQAKQGISNYTDWKKILEMTKDATPTDSSKKQDEFINRAVEKKEEIRSQISEIKGMASSLNDEIQPLNKKPVKPKTN